LWTNSWVTLRVDFYGGLLSPKAPIGERPTAAVGESPQKTVVYIVCAALTGRALSPAFG